MSRLDGETPIYLPLIKTRDAELNGFRHLGTQALNAILPIIELTRSRRSKTNPEGRVTKSIDKVLEIVDERPFVVDLTSSEARQNNEIVSLLDPARGFQNWLRFLNGIGGKLIPNIHLTDPFDNGIFTQQLSGLVEKFPKVCMRVSTSYPHIEEAISSSANILGNLDNLLLVLDAGFIEPPQIVGPVSRINRILRQIVQYNPQLCAICSSSFPSSVVNKNYGEDEFGKFELSEVTLSRAILRDRPELKIIHSDYSSIHPLDFQGTVTNWVPRVDYPLANDLYYFRYRRDDGGYVRAAKMVRDSQDYDPQDCWGEQNIVAASQGKPEGRSPSHWISVRVNSHITRQVFRLSGSDTPAIN